MKISLSAALTQEVEGPTNYTQDSLSLTLWGNTDQSSPSLFHLAGGVPLDHRSVDLCPLWSWTTWPWPAFPSEHGPADPLYYEPPDPCDPTQTTNHLTHTQTMDQLTPWYPHTMNHLTHFGPWITWPQTTDHLTCPLDHGPPDIPPNHRPPNSSPPHPQQNDRRQWHYYPSHHTCVVGNKRILIFSERHQMRTDV